LKMHHLIGHTNIDFMGLFPLCATFSVLITVVGLAIAFWRGPALLDIDFTGGTSVQTLFNTPQKIADIRSKLESMTEIFPDVTISEVRFGEEAENLRFEVNTSNPSIKQVKEELKKIFPNELASNDVSFGSISTIEAEKKTNEIKAIAPNEKPADKVMPEADSPKPKEPAKSTEPSEKKQSLRWLKTPRLLAVVSAMPLLFGQVDAATATPPEPAAAAKAETAATPTEDKTAADKPATEEKPVDKPVADKPAEDKTQAKAPVEPSVPAAEKDQGQVTDPFIGGTQIQLKFAQKLDHQTVEDLLQETFKRLKLAEKEISLEISNDSYEGAQDRRSFESWTIKIGLPQDEAKPVFDDLKTSLKASPHFPASNAIGSVVASNTQKIALYALVSSWVLIILYLWVRFQGVAFGLAAVIALIHDVLIMLGAIAFSYYLAPYFGWLYIDPFKINLPIIAAFLTIIGYSVNDTIVVFDRIREVRGKDPNLTAEMINLSTNQTLSRTLITSLTVFIVVVVLYFFAGQALRGFSFALIVGVVTGTYSSIYVAAPVLLWLIGKDKATS
jgi:SecD/SecF fusion protein